MGQPIPPGNAGKSGGTDSRILHGTLNTLVHPSVNWGVPELHKCHGDGGTLFPYRYFVPITGHSCPPQIFLTLHQSSCPPIDTPAPSIPTPYRYFCAPQYLFPIGTPSCLVGIPPK